MRVRLYESDIKAGVTKIFLVVSKRENKLTAYSHRKMLVIYNILIYISSTYIKLYIFDLIIRQSSEYLSCQKEINPQTSIGN